MDHTAPEPPATRTRPLLNAVDQSTVAILVGICLAAILLHGCWLRVVRQQRLDFDHAPPLQIDFQIDINTADWPEFTLLPGIGETLARRIVEHRQQHGPFRSVDQLTNVKGIGPKTLRRVQRYLRVD